MEIIFEENGKELLTSAGGEIAVFMKGHKVVLDYRLYVVEDVVHHFKLDKPKRFIKVLLRRA